MSTVFIHHLTISLCLYADSRMIGLPRTATLGHEFLNKELIRGTRRMDALAAKSDAVITLPVLTGADSRCGAFAPSACDRVKPYPMQCDWALNFSLLSFRAVKDKLFPAFISRRGTARRSAVRRSLQCSPCNDKLQSHWDADWHAARGLSIIAEIGNPHQTVSNRVFNPRGVPTHPDGRKMAYAYRRNRLWASESCMSVDKCTRTVGGVRIPHAVCVRHLRYVYTHAHFLGCLYTYGRSLTSRRNAYTTRQSACT